jgi:hypothetical protein
MSASGTLPSRGTTASTLFDDLVEATAPAVAQPLLAKARELFGFTPNLAVAMSAEPAARRRDESPLSNR